MVALTVAPPFPATPLPQIQISRPRLSRPDRHHLGASLLQDRANELINLAKDRMTGAGPLHLAAESGSVEAIEALSRLGWRATARDAELATALHYAAARGHAAAVASLCALGADVAARDERDCVPLHYSAGGGKWDAARALLVRGADPNAPDKDERTPLHYAARRGCPKTTGLLVNGGWGTRLDATSARGTTALSEAVEHMRAAAAEVLAAAGAAVGAEHGDGLARLLRGDGATRAGGTGVGRRGDRVGRRGDRDARAGTPAGGSTKLPWWRPRVRSRRPDPVTGVRAAAFPFLVAVVLGGFISGVGVQPAEQQAVQRERLRGARGLAGSRRPGDAGALGPRARAERRAGVGREGRAPPHGSQAGGRYQAVVPVEIRAGEQGGAVPGGRVKGRGGLTDKARTSEISDTSDSRELRKSVDLSRHLHSDKHVPTSARFEPTQAHSLDAYTHTNSLPSTPQTASMLTALNFTSAVAPTKLSVISQSASKKAGFHVVAVSHP